MKKNKSDLASLFEHWAYVVIHDDTVVGIFGNEGAAIAAGRALESHVNETVEVRKGRFFYDAMPTQDLVDYVSEVKPL